MNFLHAMTTMPALGAPQLVDEGKGEEDVLGVLRDYGASSCLIALPHPWAEDRCLVAYRSSADAAMLATWLERRDLSSVGAVDECIHWDFEFPLGGEATRAVGLRVAIGTPREWCVVVAWGSPQLALRQGAAALAVLSKTDLIVSAIREGFPVITEAEAQCLRLLSEGCQQGQVASMLGVSERTVRHRVACAQKKLRAPNLLAAIALARQLGQL